MRILTDGGIASTDDMLVHTGTQSGQSQTQQDQEPHD
jgi:hypothetical protein